MKLSDWIKCFILKKIPVGYSIELKYSEHGKWFKLITDPYSYTYFSTVLYKEYEVRKRAWLHYRNKK